jgi:hypothetical protein
MLRRVVLTTATRCNIPEDTIAHSHRRENLKYYTEKLFRMVSSEMLRHVALVRTDVSEESGASFIRVTIIGELGTTQAATSNRRTLCC